MTDAELIRWADAHVPVGPSLAVAIRRVLAERDRLAADLVRFTAAVPGTFGEAVKRWGSAVACEGHEWDNRTTAENAVWLVERLKAERDRLLAEAGRWDQALALTVADRDAARSLALGLAERVCTQSELLSGRAGRGNGAPEVKAVRQGVESGFGDWGALEGEPCRFCRAVGGVRFRSDDGPFGRAEVEVQCTRCGRSWAADSPAA